MQLTNFKNGGRATEDVSLYKEAGSVKKTPKNKKTKTLWVSPTLKANTPSLGRGGGARCNTGLCRWERDEHKQLKGVLRKRLRTSCTMR